MSNVLRKLVVALAFGGFGLWLAPASVSAATAASPSSSSITDCLKAVHHSQSGMTLDEARACAPSATVAAKAKGEGTFIVKTSHGYAIAKSHRVKATSAGDPCYWRSYWIVSGAIEWVGATQCYTYLVSTWTGTVYTNCQSYSPSGWCNRQYGYATYYGYLSQGVGVFYGQTGWFFSYCDKVYLDQWWDGSWNGDWSGC
jgi:hypothetical protein